MNRRGTPCRFLLLVAMACSFAAGASGQWEEQLEGLTPRRPLGYFELAEDVIDSVGGDRKTQALAQFLYGLAGTLDPETLGRSAALALADLEQDPRKAEQFIMLAGLLSPAGSVPLVSFIQDQSRRAPAPSELQAIGEVFSYYRNGLGGRALRVLERDGGRAHLSRGLDALYPGGFDRFMNQCATRQDGVRPWSDDADIDAMLIVESALLRHAEATFSDDLRLHGGRTLVEVDMDRLDLVFEVDPDRPFYRSGHWVSRPR